MKPIDAVPDGATDIDDDVTARWKANLEILAIGLGALLSALSQTLVIPMLPTIAGDLSASIIEVQWLLTATLLSSAVAVPVISRLADTYGRQKMVMVALGALLAGSVIDGLSSDLPTMLLGRAMSGLSVAAVPLGISLLVAVLPDERAGSAVATVGAMLGVGSALGLPVAGVIGGHLDYHVLYWISAVTAAVTLVLVRVVVRNPPGRRSGGVDKPGTLLLTAGLICLVLPLSQGSSWGWAAPATLACFAAATLLLVALVAVELRSRYPMVDMRALGRPQIAVTNVATILVGFALFSTFVGTSLYAQAPASTGYGFGSSVLVAGLLLLPNGLAMLVIAPVATHLLKVWDAGYVLCTGGSIIAGALSFRIFAYDSLWQIALGTTIAGVGTGICFACLPTMINSQTPAADLAAANGINTLARTVGSTLSSAVGGTILGGLTMTVGDGTFPSLAAYRTLFAVCTIAAAFAALCGLLLSSNRFSRKMIGASVPHPRDCGAFREYLSVVNDRSQENI